MVPARPLTTLALIHLVEARCTPAELADVTEACLRYPQQLADEMNRRGGQRIDDADIVPLFVNICQTLLRSGGKGAS
ncbi:MAG: hypothetical protein RIS45_1535 [Planctomycetota bacterium]